MVYAFYIFTYTLLYLKNLIMKPICKIIILFMAFLISNHLFAQPGRSLHSIQIIKQPRINGMLKTTTNANANAKIHANSNSVFGTGNTHPNYNKKNQPKKDEIKNDYVNDRLKRKDDNESNGNKNNQHRKNK